MIYFVTNLFRAQGYQPTIHRCAPHSPDGRHAYGPASVGPAAARARPVRMLYAHAHEAARARDVSSRACPTPRPPRRAGLSATQLALAIGMCERAASPVLLMACALLLRCRQPQLRAVGLDGHRALDIYATTGRRDVDTTVMRTHPPSRPGSPAWPRRREACEPGAVVLRLQPRRLTARPAHHRVRPRRLRPGHRRHDRHIKHHRGLVGT